MRDFSVVQWDYLEHVAQMYTDYVAYTKATTGEDERRLLFWAAYHADCVIGGVRHFGPWDGDVLAPLNGGGKIPLWKAENQAWAILKLRAQAAPTNKCEDSGARYFVNNSVNNSGEW
jgi:hypothetical protein